MLKECRDNPQIQLNRTKANKFRRFQKVLGLC